MKMTGSAIVCFIGAGAYLLLGIPILFVLFMGALGNFLNNLEVPPPLQSQYDPPVLAYWPIAAVFTIIHLVLGYFAAKKNKYHTIYMISAGLLPGFLLLRGWQAFLEGLGERIGITPMITEGTVNDKSSNNLDQPSQPDIAKQYGHWMKPRGK